MGGDELMFDYREFRPAFELAAGHGLRRTAHAGEVGPPAKIKDAIELLGAERIGHGIATIHDPALADLLAERGIPLEVCPTSNVCTGALARQLGRPAATIGDHPLARLTAAGVPVTLATDDPGMFHTDLVSEYELCVTALGIAPADLVRFAEAGFAHAFLPPEEKHAFVARLRREASALGLA